MRRIGPPGSSTPHVGVQRWSVRCALRLSNRWEEVGVLPLFVPSARSLGGTRWIVRRDLSAIRVFIPRSVMVEPFVLPPESVGELGRTPDAESPTQQ